MELNQIPQNPNNWGNVADLLNENSGKIEAETAKLNNVTTKFKGYFSSSTALSAKWPSPLVGDVAWVGATYPGVVYRCDVAGAWLATTDVPPSNTVNLSEYATQDAVSNEFASVRSDLNEIEQEQIQGGVYDVSSHNDGAVFESLSALLGSANLSTLIPISVRRGGMSIRFIQGSVLNPDNKYVQFMYLGTSTANAKFTKVINWQGVVLEEEVGGSDYNFTDTLQSSMAYTIPFIFVAGKKYVVINNSLSTNIAALKIYNGDTLVQQGMNMGEEFECLANGTGLYLYTQGTDLNVTIRTCGITDELNNIKQAIVEEDAKINNNNANITTIKDSIISPNLKDIRFGEFELGIVENEYVRNNNGEFALSGTESRTSKLYIGGLDSLMYYNTNQSAYNAWYKKDGSFISAFLLPPSSGNFNKLNVPADAYYVAFSNTKAVMQDFVLKSDVGSILENRKSVEGSKKVSYQRTKSTPSTEEFDYIFTIGHTYLIQLDFGTQELKLYDNEGIVEKFYSVNANEYYRFTPTKAATRFGAYVNRTGVINISIWEYDGTEPISLYNNQRIDSIQSGSFDGDKSVKFYNQDKIPVLEAASANPIPNTLGSRDKVYFPLIAITTDIHTDFEGLKRVYQYADEMPQIACSLMLGDICHADINDLNETMADELWNTYNKPIFRIIGNHEAQQGRLQAPPLLSDITNLLYSDDIVAHNGETHAYSKSPYWYYDLQYPNTNHKLRIIGLCQNFDPSVVTGNTYSQEQMTWFCNTLESADENTYVIVLTHTSIGSHITEDTYNDVFSVSDYLFNPHGWDATHSIIIPEIIDAWMYGKSIEHTDDLLSFSHSFNGNNATKFVCYLTGHEHWDDVHYVKEFPKQICIISDCTNNIDFQQWGDIPKTSGGKNRDGFNLFSFDPYNRHINLIKIGGDITKDMRERKFTNFALPSI